MVKKHAVRVNRREVGDQATPSDNSHNQGKFSSRVALRTRPSPASPKKGDLPVRKGAFQSTNPGCFVLAGSNTKERTPSYVPIGHETNHRTASRDGRVNGHSEVFHAVIS